MAHQTFTISIPMRNTHKSKWMNIWIEPIGHFWPVAPENEVWLKFQCLREKEPFSIDQRGEREKSLDVTIWLENSGMEITDKGVVVVRYWMDGEPDLHLDPPEY